jgi:hypothetical protein
MTWLKKSSQQSDPWRMETLAVKLKKVETTNAKRKDK